MFRARSRVFETNLGSVKIKSSGLKGDSKKILVLNKWAEQKKIDTERKRKLNKTKTVEEFKF